MEENKLTIQDLICHAKEIYPLGLFLKGRRTEQECTHLERENRTYFVTLTEKDCEELDKACQVSCSSVYMDGSFMWHIRYRK